MTSRQAAQAEPNSTGTHLCPDGIGYHALASLHTARRADLGAYQAWSRTSANLFDSPPASFTSMASLERVAN